MAYKKWISGAIGWAVAGPLGALLGYGLASLLEKNGDQSGDDFKSKSGERNSFLVSLLVLTSAIMKADGKVMKSELNYVKDFLVRNFGPDAGAEALLYLRNLLEKEVDIEQVCAQIKRHMNYEARVQLLHYLSGVAKVDGIFNPAEHELLKRIALLLDISAAESVSIFAMYDTGYEAAYKILEIPIDATDEEVKRAYRQMALRHHPDKVSNLGPDIQAAAEERFKKIGEAYETIRKEREIK